MKKISRRDFLKIVGGGSAVAAAGAVLPQFALSAGRSPREALTFRAVGGLPGGTLPSYASLVLEGGVNMTSRTGVVTKNVFAGTPDAMSTMALPGLARIIRVTNVRESGNTLHITGRIDDSSQLMRGESSTVHISVDRSAGLVKTRFNASDVALRLER